ncbi:MULTISPECIES: Asp23/Gls24 family envelope stress response protein [unclassified Nonomuraea]|uniref:Asp23/Gls24 family envelope stress response protein n=1 Tax=Nonomuraea sp. NPDC003804 TaxID=3154547 RepID=UPI0033AA1FB3
MPSNSGSTTTTVPRARTQNDTLVTEQGRTTIADGVVAKIAGLAAREVAGVHDMGGGAGRAIGAMRGMVGAERSVTQGVQVEVGERQAAVDLDLIVEYGAAIPDLAGAVRRNVIAAIERMTGLEVTEVNVNVNDVHLPESARLPDSSGQRESRVQ